MEKEEYKLKPCPICGSEVNMIKEGDGEYTVVCHGCQVLMIADDVSSKNEAIERWNNRVNGPKWIPIEQQKPPDDCWYLVFYPKDAEFGDVYFIDVCFGNKGGFNDSEIGYQEDGIEYTHWMPLPEPPKGE